MTDQRESTRPPAPRAARARKAEDGASKAKDSEPEISAAESERRLARSVAQLAPATTVIAAGLVGALTSIGPAILVVAGGALFATIAFFWASLRTLGGDAPLAPGFDQMARRRVESSFGTAERKRTALRALKDIEMDHALGKLDDTDYADLSSSYREQAKSIFREIEETVRPQRARAEQLAHAYLTKRGVVAGQPSDHGATPRPKETREPRRRVECSGCSSSNEPDATFCKGCGARLAPQVCPDCATVRERDSSSCKKCGRSLGAPTMEKTDASR